MFLEKEKNASAGDLFPWFLVLFPLAMEIVHDVFKKRKKEKVLSSYTVGKVRLVGVHWSVVCQEEGVDSLATYVCDDMKANHLA